MQELMSFQYCLIEVKDRGFRDLLSAKRQQRAAQRSGSVRGRLDLGDCPTQTLVRPSFFDQDLAVSHDNAQIIVEFMGGPAGKLFHSFDLLYLPQLMLQVSLLGDILSAKFEPLTHTPLLG